MRWIALVVLVALTVPAHAADRELASWADLAGAWEGTGSDAQGPFAMTARIEPAFEGRYLTIHTREVRGDQTLREQLGIWAAGDAGVRLFHYEASTHHRRLPGKPGTAADTLHAGDPTYAMRWQRTPDGLTGARFEAAMHGSGEPVETARWSLKRAAASREAQRRGDVENFEYFDGELQGDGESAVTPGSASGAHFTAREFGVAMLADTIVVSRQKLAYDAGDRVEEALLVHGVQADRPFRHVFLARGGVDVFQGAFTDIGQMTFEGATPLGEMKVSLAMTCGGYKLRSEWVRPGQPAVWIGDMEMHNLAGSDKAMRGSR